MGLFKKFFIIATVFMVLHSLLVKLPAQALNVLDDKEAHSNNGTEGKTIDNSQRQAPQKKTVNNVTKSKTTTRKTSTKKVTTKKNITPSVKPAPARVPSDTLPPELRETFPEELTQLRESFLTDWDFNKMSVRHVEYDMYKYYMENKLYKNYADYEVTYGEGFYSTIGELERFDDGGIGLSGYYRVWYGNYRRWGNFIVPLGWEARVTPIEVKNSNGEVVKLAKGLNNSGIVKTYENNEYIVFKGGTIVEVYHQWPIYPRWLSSFDKSSLRNFDDYRFGGRQEWLKSIKLVFYRVH